MCVGGVGVCVWGVGVCVWSGVCVGVCVCVCWGCGGGVGCITSTHCFHHSL